jgi:N-methylhydantoinase A/acetone carboxylase, beta subunit
MLGTTHCTNAIVERKGLRKVAVIRIGKPATMAIKPMVGWPQDLIDAIGKKYFIIKGGHEFDGQEINELDYDEIDQVINEIRGKFEAVAISSVFSPVNTSHEDTLEKILVDRLGDSIDVCVSHEIGSIGLIRKRERNYFKCSLRWSN